MKPSDFLRKGWTIRHFARDKYGLPENPHSPEACCFCIMGAFDVARQHKFLPELENFLSLKIGKEVSVADFNDNYCKSQEEAIKVVEEFEQLVGIN